MTHTRLHGPRHGDVNPEGADDVEAPLTPLQTRILTVITDKILQTGLAPSRREIAQAVGYEREQSIATALLTLARRNRINLGAGGHRAIRVVDHDEAPIIELKAHGECDDPGGGERHMVERMPGTLVRRLEKGADFFIRIERHAVAGPGIPEGSLAAVRRTSGIRTGSIVVARDERGAWIYHEAKVTNDRRLILTPTGAGEAETERTQAQTGDEATLRIEGVLAGVVQAAAMGGCESSRTAGGRRGRLAASARCQTRPGGVPVREPSPQQASVLDIIRTHVRQRGLPPSLREMGDELGRTTGTVQKHLEALVTKGWVERTPGVQRGYWPTDRGTVPIVDPGERGRGAEEGLRSCRIVERMPGVLVAGFDPRPDCFVAVTKEMAEGLGIDRNDLIAIEAATEADEGEIVVARIGEMRHLVCGELRRHDGRHQELHPMTGAAAGGQVVVEATDRRLQIEGVVIGCVTFRGLEGRQAESDGTSVPSGS